MRAKPILNVSCLSILCLCCYACVSSTCLWSRNQWQKECVFVFVWGGLEIIMVWIQVRWCVIFTSRLSTESMWTIDNLFWQWSDTKIISSEDIELHSYCIRFVELCIYEPSLQIKWRFNLHTHTKRDFVQSNCQCIKLNWCIVCHEIHRLLNV